MFVGKTCMKGRYLFVFFMGMLATVISEAGSRPDGHAPIGVMGDHTHKAGEYMVSYRYMYMKMADVYNGNDTLSLEDAYGEIDGMSMNMGMMTTTAKAMPDSMVMRMNMVGIMYAPTDQITLMGMINYLDNDMTSDRQAIKTGGMGTTTETDNISTSSKGWGDTRFVAMYQFYQGLNDSAHVNFGLSLPTGSINKTDYIPEISGMMGENKLLAYPMQLGSGSYGAILGVTWLQQLDTWSYGAQLNTLWWMNDNDQDYRLGDSGNINAWIAYLASSNLSISGRVQQSFWGNISGATDDSEAMSAAMNPAADTDTQGGNQTDIAFGMNLLLTEGLGKGQRFAFEYILPVYRDLDGPQLGDDYQIVVGWQYAWK